MNELLEFLNSHVSVRKFSGIEISEEDEKLIVTTAQRSPTSSNIQAYSIIGVRDRERKEKLSELSGNQNHVVESSLFLVFCADLYRLKMINDKKGYPFNGEYTETFIIATVDAALAASRALTAAQALGMGGVMVGAIRNHPDKVCELLNLPDLTYAVMGMSLGYPEGDAKLKPRLPLDAVYHKEKYSSDKFEKNISEYDKTMDELGYLNIRQVQTERYPEFEGIYSWSEHTARRMANNNPLARRDHMLEFLHGRGFLKK